jgi:hypothetical protein
MHLENIDLKGYSIGASWRRDDNVVNIHKVRTLTDKEAVETSNALAVLGRYAAHNNLFILTELNYRDLELALAEYNANFRKYSGNILALGTVINNCSRLILNYLSSFRMFTDHSETALKRRFGKDSRAFSEYKAIESRQYDSVFAYRFLYRFRNFVQHLGLPIEKISHTDTRELGPEPLKIMMTKRRLLEDRDVWGAVVTEIESLPDEISITEYFPQLRPCVEVLRAAYHAEDGDKIVPAKDSLVRLINEIGASIGKPCFPLLLAMPEGGRENMKLQINHFPLHVLGVFPEEDAPE